MGERRQQPVRGGARQVRLACELGNRDAGIAARCDEAQQARRTRDGLCSGDGVASDVHNMDDRRMLLHMASADAISRTPGRQDGGITHTKE